MNQTAISLSPGAQDAIAEALNQSVAETAVATVLAQNFHWNVEGMAFGPLHALFQTIYEDHFIAQDDLAERIKALDRHAVGNMAAWLSQSKVTEAEGTSTDREMIAALLTAQEQLTSTLAGLQQVSTEHGDTLTEDLAIERGRVHEKFAWMLRAHLKG